MNSIPTQTSPHTDWSGWLFAQGGPILKLRVGVDQLHVAGRERARLAQAALATAPAQYWLARLAEAQQVHGSADTAAENALAKLLEFGFDRRLPALHQGVRRLLRRPRQQWDELVLLPFLVRAGYAAEPPVAGWLAERVEKLYRTAQQGSFDFYLSPAEAAGVPAAWRGQPIYRDAYGHAAGYALPTCYDFYTLAYCPPEAGGARFAAQREAIVAFLSAPAFQATPGGYGWDRPRRRCYAAGRVFLACVEPARQLLFLELGAQVAAARRSAWYQAGLASLAQYQTPDGAYSFPPAVLAEKTGTSLYSGTHLGLGENLRTRRGRLLESTFRMLRLQAGAPQP